MVAGSAAKWMHITEMRTSGPELPYKMSRELCSPGPFLCPALTAAGQLLADGLGEDILPLRGAQGLLYRGADHILKRLAVEEGVKHRALVLAGGAALGDGPGGAAGRGSGSSSSWKPPSIQVS